MAKGNVLKKLFLGLTALVVLGVLFISTLREVSSTPYSVSNGNLTKWKLELVPFTGSDGPLLILRPPTALPLALFDEVFQRTMESFTAPLNPGVPLVMQQEFSGALSGIVSPEDLVVLAREIGLEDSVLEPNCMAVHRTSDGREQRQFFVLFDFPEYLEFRNSVMRLLDGIVGNGKSFKPDGLPPALLVATTDANLLWRFPSRDILTKSCEAQVVALLAE